MKPRTIITALFLTHGVLSAFGETDTARDLKQLQEQRDKAVAAATEPITRRYAVSLEVLLRRAMQANDLDTANAARGELQKLGITASSTGSGAGTALGATDEAKRNALRTLLRDSKWKIPSNGGSIRLHADGTTTASWHGRTGKWKVTGLNTVEASFTNSGSEQKGKIDDAATTISFGEPTDPNPTIAKRVQP